MIFPSFFLSMIVGATAFLQAEAAWWKGLAAAVSLYFVSIVVFAFAPEGAIFSGQSSPHRGLIGTLVLLAYAIGAGALFSLALRRRIDAVRLGVIAFFAALIVLNVLFFVLAVNL